MDIFSAGINCILSNQHCSCSCCSTKWHCSKYKQNLIRLIKLHLNSFVTHKGDIQLKITIYVNKAPIASLSFTDGNICHLWFFSTSFTWLHHASPVTYLFVIISRKSLCIRCISVCVMAPSAFDILWTTKNVSWKYNGWYLSIIYDVDQIESLHQCIRIVYYFPSIQILHIHKITNGEHVCSKVGDSACYFLCMVSVPLNQPFNFKLKGC